MKRLVVLQHIEREGPELFASIAEEKGYRVKIYRLDNGDDLPKLEKNDLLLIMGGPMGVNQINEEYPWLKEEIKLIKKSLKQNISIIGICLGAQLLAYACGGKIEKLKRNSSSRFLAEIGWAPIHSLENDIDDELKNIIKDLMYVLHWHGDRIILPPNAKLIASSQYCKEQLFKINERSYGLQFHIETNYEMIEKWICEDKDFISLALGHNGQSILKEENKIYSNSTLSKRISFINKLIDIVTKKAQ